MTVYNGLSSKSMKKDLATVIEIARVLAPVVSSRDVVDLLKIQILESETRAVILDFKNVEFVSRSAAHELLVIKETAHQKNIEVSFENANKDVSEMLRIVAANRALPKAEKPRFEPEKTDIDSLREEVVV